VAVYAGVCALLRDLPRFVGQNPTEAKTKIQGFTLTDRLSAVRLSSARGENMEKMIFAVLLAAFLCFGATKRRNWLIQVALTSAFLFALAPPRLLAQEVDMHNPIGIAGIFNGNVTTGCSYDPLSHSAHREVTDIVVPGSIGKYPLKMTRHYNSRLGPGWRGEYDWTVSLDGSKLTYPNGNVLDKRCQQPVGISDWWQTLSCDQNGCDGDFRLADGGTVHFANSVTTAIDDPYGQTTTITRTSNRMTVTEPGGRYLLFKYEGPQNFLSTVEAHGLGNATVTDWVTYSYTLTSPGGNGTSLYCLTGVTYSDGTAASYTYTQDNVQTQYKVLPLLATANDVRYTGPMRSVTYEYQPGGPHGAITKERYSPTGAVVSSITPGATLCTTFNCTMETDFTETRGDGPSRTFHYTDLTYQSNPQEPGCPEVSYPQPPSQFLKNYTDFQGRKTWLGYDGNWYVNSVTDARGTSEGDPNHTILYQRGQPPPNGIGEILSITYPSNMGTVQYAYYVNGNTYDPHYLNSITDERGNKTVHTRDPSTHKITQTDYKAADGTLLARETFAYCDQAGDPQCGNQAFGQLKTHRLKNDAYVHYRYDQRGLLIDKWEPTWNSSASDREPKTHYDYYTTSVWADRVKTVTGPPPNWAYTDGPASETYEYDKNAAGSPVPGRGLVTKITYADPVNGPYRSFGYDAYGNKLWEKNELLNRTSYAYDDYNRVTSVTRPLNGITNYTYNPTNGTGSPLSHTTNNPDTVTVRTSATTNIVTTNVYDENFRKTSATVAGAPTWFHYDPVGNQDWATDPRGTVGRTYPNGDPAYTTNTDYDNRNRKWQVREPLGRVTQFYYDDKINVTRIVRNDNTGNVTETKAYDGMNRLATDTVPKETGVDIVTRFQYYPWNVRSASLLQTVTDGESHNTTFEYDPSGLKTKMTYPDNSTQSWTYDDAHNLKSRTTVAVPPETQNFAYDNRNRKTGEWWDGLPPDAEWRFFAYDDANHLVRAMNGLGNIGSNIISDVGRSYDDAGRLTLDRQNVTGLGIKDVAYPTYDDDGRLTQMNVSGVSPAYDYTFGYDNMRRLQFIFSTGNQNALFQYSYDLASNETQRYNWQNRVAQIYAPDALNRTTSVEVKNTTTNTRLGIETYDYYTIGRLHTVTREDNKQDQFVYFLDGELKQATYGAAPTPPPSPSPTPTPTTPPGQVATPTFNPDGADYSACANSYTFNVTISTTTSGAQIRWTIDGTTPSPTNGTLINGSSGTASFTVGSNQTKTLKAIAYKTGMTPSNIHSADYTFVHECAGPNGPMAPESDGIIPYPLDTVGGRFNQAPMAPAVSTVTYDLDKAGNRRSAYGQNYSPNTINQYTSVGGNPVTNGNDHEIQVWGGFTYAYMRDQELQQISAPGLTYAVAYDALGRCVKRSVNGDPTYYIYDGDKPILEYRSNGALARNLYGIGIDEILQRYDPAVNGGQWFYFQQDHEGSVTHLTNWNNGSGQIIERYRYDAFGTPTIYAPNWTQRTTSSYNNRFLFTAREYAGAWVYEYRARVYHAALGRFMSEDPKLFDAGDYNLFRYCHNDPIDLTDPMGTSWEHIAQAIALDKLAATKELLGGGAIEIGSLRYAIGRLAHAEGLLKIAQKEFGVKEVPGARSNPHVIQYLKTTSIDPGMYNDSTAWCSAFVNWVVKQGGLKGTNSAAALSWRHWGEDAHGPVLGAIAVIDYGHGSGHVGFVAGVTTQGRILLLGGNQRDAVRYSLFGTSKIIGFRIPASLTFYNGSPVLRGLLPAPLYHDTGAALEFDGTR
jgi:uncharacterized protein (TIGR02594 family)